MDLKKRNCKSLVKSFYYIVSFAFALFSSFAIVINGKTSFKTVLSSKKEEEVSFALNNIESDYDIPGLSLDQIDTLKEDSNVNSLLPYYGYFGNLTYKGNNYSSNINFLDNFDNMNLTPYLDGRFYQEMSVGENPLYVDSIFANETGCQLGDKLTMKIGAASFTYQIVGIAGPNYIEGFKYLNALITPEVKEAIKEAFISYGSFQYSSTYVNAKSTEDFYLNIKNYKPEAQRLPREAFSSDLDYLQYTDDFDKKDYSSDIIDVQSKLNKVKDLSNKYDGEFKAQQQKMTLFLLLELLGIALVESILFFFYLRRVSIGFSNPKDHLIACSICSLISLLIQVSVFFIVISNFPSFYNLQYVVVLSSLLWALLAIVGVMILSYGLNFVLTKRLIKNK